MYQLQITERAKNDLRDLFEYSLEAFGEKVGNEYYEKLLKFINTIKSQPFKGHNHQFLSDLYRVVNLGSHIIVYIIDEKVEIIKVIRILHNKMNISNELLNK
jgi:toxin ParE1/3/4